MNASRSCPHCAANGIVATLELTTTARGQVERCWQCGGEYAGDDLVWPKFCELCVDPINKPHIDEDGTRRWRACPNLATRKVLDDSGRELNVCEEHFGKEAQ
jgi:hypothetical protein